MPRKPGSKAIVVHNNKICLVLRDNNPNIPHPNMWNTPGGMIEENETPKEAIIREVKEEINLDATDVIETGSTTYSDGSIVYRYFIPVTDEQLKKIYLVHEGQRLEWLTVEQIRNIAKEKGVTEYFMAYFEKNIDTIKDFLEGGREFEPRHEIIEVQENKSEKLS